MEDGQNECVQSLSEPGTRVTPDHPLPKTVWLRNLTQKTSFQSVLLQVVTDHGVILESDHVTADLDDAVEIQIDGKTLLGEVVHLRNTNTTQVVGLSIVYSLV
jgi:hypothetical protein